MCPGGVHHSHYALHSAVCAADPRHHAPRGHGRHPGLPPHRPQDAEQPQGQTGSLGASGYRPNEPGVNHFCCYEKHLERSHSGSVNQLFQGPIIQRLICESEQLFNSVKPDKGSSLHDEKSTLKYTSRQVIFSHCLREVMHLG